MSFLSGILVKKVKGRIIVIAALILVVGLTGAFLFGERLENKLSSEPSQGQVSSDFNLGVTYLTITPSVAAYYDLGVDSGVLVTAVTPSSLADQVGIKPGDVIVSYNTVQLDTEAPLYGMMRSCRPGTNVILEVQTGNTTNIFEFVHTVR